MARMTMLLSVASFFFKGLLQVVHIAGFAHEIYLSRRLQILKIAVSGKRVASNVIAELLK